MGTAVACAFDGMKRGASSDVHSASEMSFLLQISAPKPVPHPWQIAQGPRGKMPICRHYPIGVRPPRIESLRLKEVLRCAAQQVDLQALFVSAASSTSGPEVLRGCSAVLS
jgi:hypothetical protein